LFDRFKYRVKAIFKMRGRAVSRRHRPSRLERNAEGDSFDLKAAVKKAN